VAWSVTLISPPPLSTVALIGPRPSGSMEIVTPSFPWTGTCAGRMLLIASAVPRDPSNTDPDAPGDPLDEAAAKRPPPRGAAVLEDALGDEEATAEVIPSPDAPFPTSVETRGLPLVAGDPEGSPCFRVPI